LRFIDRELLLTRKILNQGFLVVSRTHHFERFTVVIVSWLTVTEYNPFLIHDLLPGTRVIRRVPLVEQEVFTLWELS
jgi:hypothetical protein